MRGIISEGSALQPVGEPPDEVTVAIEKTLAELPPRTREVAELRLRYQCFTPEIAAELDITPATVARHIRRVTVALNEGLPARLA
jgi:DNA-directed RNA polymerase specialized sigma24 family protein